MTGDSGCLHCGDDTHNSLCDTCEQLLDKKKQRLEQEFTGNEKIASATETILEELGVDRDNPNFANTPNRVARAFIERNERCFSDDEERLDEMLSTEFNSDYDDFVIVDPITTSSMCSHHLQVVILEVYVGYIPEDHVVGLSKIPRAVNYLTSKPTLQEDITGEIADVLYDTMDPKSLIVHISGVHHCMASRGVEEKDASMTTTALRGEARDDKSQVSEFFDRLNLEQ